MALARDQISGLEAKLEGAKQAFENAQSALQDRTQLAHQLQEQLRAAREAEAEARAASERARKELVQIQTEVVAPAAHERARLEGLLAAAREQVAYRCVGGKDGGTEE